MWSFVEKALRSPIEVVLHRVLPPPRWDKTSLARRCEVRDVAGEERPRHATDGLTGWLAGWRAD